MSAPTPGRAVFEAFQRRRYPSGHGTPWEHRSVEASRQAWEDGGMAAIELCAGPVYASALRSASDKTTLLSAVRRILADGQFSEAGARQAALELIDQEDTAGEFR